MNKEATIYTIIFIFIVSFVFVLLLSLANQVTVARVELNQELARRSAILSAMGIDATGQQEIQAAFAKIKVDQQDGLYAGQVNGQTVYAKSFAGPGLWGTISGYIAVDSSISKFVGIEIVSDSETPGLGARINEAWFKDQFRGEVVPANGTIGVKALPGDGDPNKTDGIVDGITGATRTSDSMQAIVNAAIKAFNSPQIRQKLQQLATSGGNA